MHQAATSSAFRLARGARVEVDARNRIHRPGRAGRQCPLVNPSALDRPSCTIVPLQHLLVSHELEWSSHEACLREVLIRWTEAVLVASPVVEADPHDTSTVDPSLQSAPDGAGPSVLLPKSPCLANSVAANTATPGPL
eukprot:CAMPEP_0180810186 /NCGR_PEP_ID=MMETSP1038_2-20121128/64745_1 /TAXON_ID=632150 /ORGANISM="Azadinium spinosum, Strain 3D9" /LENGTH=137 /DNA_ID=CAMNT_0022851449 /DNA_START=216 /DNA_END=630 /DNA_ORIENTATION=+